jgi:hypothetical protein
MDFYRWVKCQWDRATAVVAALVGVVALLLGWLGVSRSGLPSEQIPYLASGAVLGLFALGVGATLWLSADMRDEWRKLEQIHQDLSAGRADGSLATGEATVLVADDEDELEPSQTAQASGRRERPLRAPADAGGRRR